MANEYPLVSVIIPVHPAKTEARSAAASKLLDYPREKLEIIVVRSTDLATFPSMKRNAAIRAAKGELIYFLDDDSVPLPGNLKRAVAHFADPKVQMVGGPNVCPEDAPTIEKTFANVMGSWLAFGPSCARYRSVGKLRESNEKELISCNLVSRRGVLLESGGFDESLYPNEENALMDAVLKRGKLLYDPEMIVHRRPRSNFKSFAKMLFSYGGGRAQQFRLHPTAGSFINFVPPAFCLYLLALLILVPTRIIPMPWSMLALVPLALYLAAVLVQTLAVMARTGVMGGLRALPLLALTNILYGAGILRGFFSKIAHVKPGGATDIRLETVSV
ncbi:MAG TPA: glycosyltransferase [Candidatus Baltobacteraceae bacterium]|nr:glycosyltransferase [Candidatus Baltobacteraceae bacterium]